MIEGFLNNLEKEIGYKFGNPWRYSDKSMGVVIPILKIGDFDDRIYITLEEAKDQGISFKDTGKINKVIIESSIGKPIFVRSGTALKGIGTQPRAVEESIVIIPEKGKEDKKMEQEINVRCIHASMPISGNAGFSYAGDVSSEVRLELLSRSGQSKTWDAVGRSTSRFMASRSSVATHLHSDNLVGIMEEVDKFQTKIDDILKKVPLFEDQVGAVFMDMKDVSGLEMFDHPKSWEAIHKEVEKRLGEESIAKEEENTFFKPDFDSVKPLILRFLKKLLESEKTEVSKGRSSTVSLKGDGVVGEATMIDGKVIHLVGMRIDKNKNIENGMHIMSSRVNSIMSRTL